MLIEIDRETDVVSRFQSRAFVGTPRFDVREMREMPVMEKIVMMRSSFR